MSFASPKLVLLPGLDGTGDLFQWFIEALPPAFDATVVRYPPDDCLSEEELTGIIQSAFPALGSFVLLAESFSTPLAIRCAARSPRGLKGLVLCAGFAADPAGLWSVASGSRLARLAFTLGIPAFAVKAWLLGKGAPPELVRAVQKSIAKVRSSVLVDRLEQIASCDALSDLRKIDVPMLYLRATKDRLVPSRCLEEILDVKPQTGVVEVPGPHLLLQREPKLAADAVTNFLLRFDQMARSET